MKRPSNTGGRRPPTSSDPASTSSIMQSLAQHVQAWQAGMSNLAEAIDHIEDDLQKLKAKRDSRPLVTFFRGNTTPR